MSSKIIEIKIPTLQSDDPRVSIGQFTYGNPRFMIWTNEERIEIGRFCSIAENVTIFAGGEHNTQWVTTYPLRIAFGDDSAEKDGHPKTKGKTIIGNDVWIGYGAIVLSGVKIGNGAVVGASSVITKDVPPYAIVAGNPAKIVRYRFSEKIITELLEIGWWFWPIEKIKQNTSLLCNNNIDAFIDKAINNPNINSKLSAKIKDLFGKTNNE